VQPILLELLVERQHTIKWNGQEVSTMRLGKASVAVAFSAMTLMALTITASATPPSGFVGGPQVRGTLPSDIRLKADGVKFQTSGQVDVVVQTIAVSPGGFSGWHTHPGFVLAVVESGSATLQVGCSITTYTAGQSFYETGTTPVMARNLTQQDYVLRVTYVVPKGAATRRDVLAKDAPRCDGAQETDQQQEEQQ
jgi:quercetin dioxygenase-like cupin family protein